MGVFSPSSRSLSVLFIICTDASSVGLPCVSSRLRCFRRNPTGDWPTARTNEHRPRRMNGTSFSSRTLQQFRRKHEVAVGHDCIDLRCIAEVCEGIAAQEHEVRLKPWLYSSRSLS